MGRFRGIQNAAQNSRRHRELREPENPIQHKLTKILKQKEMIRYQRSKVNLLVDGDMNNHIYHVGKCKEEEGRQLT